MPVGVGDEVVEDFVATLPVEGDDSFVVIVIRSKSDFMATSLNDFFLKQLQQGFAGAAAFEPGEDGYRKQLGVVSVI